MARAKARTRIGVVKSNKMDKTVVVEIVSTVKHKVYNKPIKRSSTYKVHDKENKCSVGDKVQITESKPISKTKRWRVSKIIQQKVVPDLQIKDEAAVVAGEDQ
ncbi:MAG TPA: 30S ribosomal protein S17 [Thermodesulfobacteriota bacterium]|nr:30S ribosomal protein S17 [Thermodesulfobacteriota bacterium]